jgi:hypothetical protein
MRTTRIAKSTPAGKKKIKKASTPSLADLRTSKHPALARIAKRAAKSARLSAYASTIANTSA